MSFTRWLRNLRSALAANPVNKHRRQPSLRAATNQPRLELLEDRCLLSFTPAAGYPAGAGPQSVLTGDFNGDGQLDLAVANFSADTVSVLPGDSDGTFQPALTSATGSGPQSLAVGDFNGDGKLDLVTANVNTNASGSYDVSVLLGKGDGTFETPVSVPVSTGSSPTSVAVGDFNADGKMDLGVTSNVYNAGTPPTPGTPGSYVYHPGDYTYEPYPPGTGGDWTPTPGYTEYFPGTPGTPGIPPSYEGRVNVLLGHGDGTFAETPNTTSLGFGRHTSASVAVGDFNGDGKLDLGVTSNGWAGGSWGYWDNYYPGYNVSYANVVLGNGDGSFSWPHASWLGDGYHSSVVVADFNGDSIPDFAAANSDYGTVSVLLGTGTGYFSGLTDFSAGNYPTAVAAGDFNRDGHIDLVSANMYGDNVSVLLGDGHGTFQIPRAFAAGANPLFAAVGDFNGDFFADVAVANTWSDGVSVLLNDGIWNSLTVNVSDVSLPTLAGVAHTVTVTARDNVGNLLTGYTGTIHFSSSDPQAVLPADYTFTAADNCTHTFTLEVTLKTAGTQSLAVTDTTSGFAARQDGIVVNPAATSTFVVASFPSRPVGAAGAFYVIPQDAFGNWVPFYTGTVHFTSTDTLATLPAPYTFTYADHGFHWFNATFWTAGAQSLTATDTAAATGTQSNIEVTTASRFVVTGLPSNATAGTAATFSVLAVDINGTVVPGYRGTVHFSSSDAAATLPGDYAFTNGVVNFAATLRSAGTQSVTVTDTLSPSITGSQAGIRVIPLASVTGPSAGFRNQTLTFTLGASGMPAGTAFSYAIDWNGDGSTDQTITGPSGVTVDHAYAASGAYTIGVTATIHIGTQDYVSNKVYNYVTISAASVSIQTDPGDATKKALVVEGTASADTLVLSPGTGNSIAVSINGASVGTFAAPGGVPFAHLLVYGYGGNDTLQLSGVLTVPAFLFGGDGNDTLNAGVSTANNVLVGGANTDALTGGKGRDLLIGGLGADTLRASGGDDILIGAYSDYDANLTALCILMKEWGRTDADYSTRVKHLSGTLGGGLNGSYFLSVKTVHTVYDDAAIDNMFGDAGMDWYFARTSGKYRDKVNNKSTGEVVTALS